MATALEEHRQSRVGRKLIVNIKVSPDGVPLVSSCELVGKDYRNRTSFARLQPIDAVFRTVVADGVRSCVAALDKKTCVVALPNFALEEQGVILSRAQVVATETLDGGSSVILRFTSFVGSLAKVFNPHIDLVSGLEDATLNIADQIMFDLSMPLLNFLSLDEIGGVLQESDAERLLAQLMEQSHALRFQIELIKRHMGRIEKDRDMADGQRSSVIPIRAFEDTPAE